MEIVELHTLTASQVEELLGLMEVLDPTVPREFDTCLA